MKLKCSVRESPQEAKREKPGENGAAESTTTGGKNNQLKTEIKKTEDGGEEEGEKSQGKLFRGETVTDSHTATFKNMDTLFPVFLGLLFLFSAVGNVSGQIPTGKDKTQEK